MKMHRSSRVDYGDRDSHVESLRLRRSPCPGVSRLRDMISASVYMSYTGMREVFLLSFVQYSV